MGLPWGGRNLTAPMAARFWREPQGRSFPTAFPSRAPAGRTKTRLADTLQSVAHIKWSHSLPDHAGIRMRTTWCRVGRRGIWTVSPYCAVNCWIHAVPRDQRELSIRSSSAVERRCPGSAAAIAGEPHPISEGASGTDGAAFFTGATPSASHWYRRPRRWCLLMLTLDLFWRRFVRLNYGLGIFAPCMGQGATPDRRLFYFEPRARNPARRRVYPPRIAVQ